MRTCRQVNKRMRAFACLHPAPLNAFGGLPPPDSISERPTQSSALPRDASAQTPSEKLVVYNHITQTGATPDPLVHQTYDAEFKVLEALAQWELEPARINGQDVSTAATLSPRSTDGEWTPRSGS